MSDGANKAFKSDPAGFLRDNVILLKEGGMPAVAGCYKVNLRPAPGDEVKDYDGRALKVWIPYLAQDDPTKTDAGDHGHNGDASVGRMALPGKSDSWFSNQFKAFYIPWGPNATHVEDLDKRADFMFTPGLTGCTFAATGGGNPRAGHFNYQREGTDKVSASRTASHVTKTFGDDVAVGTKKADYVQAEGEMQRYLYIVGWRESSLRWRFYRQHLVYAGAGKGMIYTRLEAPSEIIGAHEVGSA